MKKRSSVLVVLVLMLALFSSVVGAKEVDLTILHTNDTHARVEEGEYAGMGFAKIATIVKQAKKEASNVLLVDAGDAFHGQPIANLVEGKSIARIYNALGYDAMVPGNHDFNYGHQRLAELDQITDFPLISANIVKADNNKKFRFQPGEIKKIEGIKVAILGLTTPETAYKTHPKNVEGLEFKDPIKTAQGMIDMLKKKENPDLIIGLSHLGISEGSDYTSKQLAKKVPELDLIIDGHSHEQLEDGLVVNKTPIVMAGEYTKALGIVNLTIKDGKITKGKSELVTKQEAAKVKKDQEVLKLVKDIKAKNEKVTSQVVGQTEVELNGARSDIRTGETNFGNLVTDAMLSAVEADVAITNGGGIRQSIAAGEITRGDIIKALPFGNYLVVKEVKGRVILEAIEHGISQYPAKEGLFPQVGGMSFIFDTTQPAGKRGLELRVKGQPINPKQEYKVAINDFMAAGGDGYEMFKDTKTVQEAGGLAEVVVDYIKQEDSISPTQEGRILPLASQNDQYQYTIQWGDTLSELAQWFEVDMAKLVELNDIEDPDLIYAGNNLVLPTK